jgi:hypothetical protein
LRWLRLSAVKNSGLFVDLGCGLKHAHDETNDQAGADNHNNHQHGEIKGIGE